MTDEIDFSALLDRPEDKMLDFKAKGYNSSKRKDKRAFAKDLASLTNTPRDDNAYVVLGVKKHVDGSIDLIGLEKGIDDSDLQAIAGSYLEPAPQFTYRPIQHCGVHLGLITIPPNQENPSHQGPPAAKISSKVVSTFGVGHEIPQRRHTNRREFGIGFAVESVLPNLMKFL